jgi:hypothetical protein
LQPREESLFVYNELDELSNEDVSVQLRKIVDADLESEANLEADDSPRQFVKCMEVSINPKIPSKPILEVKKCFWGEFFIPKKAPIKLQKEQINFAEKSEGGTKTVI